MIDNKFLFYRWVNQACVIWRNCKYYHVFKLNRLCWFASQRVSNEELWCFQTKSCQWFEMPWHSCDIIPMVDQRLHSQMMSHIFSASSVSLCWGGWGCEVSCGGHHRLRGKTSTGSALDGAVFDIAQILAYLVHNMSRSQLCLGSGHFGWLFLVNNILAGLWLNCISSVEITLFLLADISLQHGALFQC